MMTSAAIIQARMGSTRLPGKVMRPLCGRTILGHVLTRALRCPLLYSVVVATTTQPADEAIAIESQRYGAQVFRGSETDVLARYYEAARAHQVELIVRITSDCPFLDPDLLARMLTAFQEHPTDSGRTTNRNSGDARNEEEVHGPKACAKPMEALQERPPAAPPLDYLSNTLRRTFPRGLDLELFTFAALERAVHEAVAPPEREHVTPYIYGHPERFRLSSFEQAIDRSSLRWTLDTPEDWQFIQAVYEALGPRGEMFSTEKILDWLQRRPELTRLDAHVEQKSMPP